MKKEDIRIVARVTKKEKERINSIAEKCGLSTTEYIRQRALGFEPRSGPPGALFVFCEKLDALVEQPFSGEVNAAALALLKDISIVQMATEEPTEEISEDENTLMDSLEMFM